MQDLGMVITQNMQLHGAVCAQRDLTRHLLRGWVVLRQGEAEVPKIEQTSLVTEINGLSFFLFLSFRSIRIVILYLWLEVTDSISLYIVYNVKRSTWVSQNQAPALSTNFFNF